MAPTGEPRIGRTTAFEYTLEHAEYGAGDRVVVLLHGLLFSRRLDHRLAAALAERGFRVVCIDQIGHGGSDRPLDPRAYSVQQFAQYTLAVLDGLDIDAAVIAGRSLGANTALEIAVAAPRRVRGIVAEGPILEGAQLVAAAGFGTILLASTAAAPLMRLVGVAARRMPRGRDLVRDVLLDAVSGDPRATAALLRGLSFGRTAPPSAERTAITAKTLVIGYPKDPLHRDSEVRTLLAEIPGSRYLSMRSMYELHTGPEDRLIDPYTAFLDECWSMESHR